MSPDPNGAAERFVTSRQQEIITSQGQSFMRSLIAFLALSLGTTACSEAPKGGNNSVGNDVTPATPIGTVDPGNRTVGTVANEATGASSDTGCLDPVGRVACSEPGSRGQGQGPGQG